MPNIKKGVETIKSKHCYRYPSMGILDDRATEEKTHLVPVENGVITIYPGFTIPVAPIVGTVGVLDRKSVV